MPKVKIRHSLGLTFEEAMRIFTNNFGTKYEIYRRKAAIKVFVIKKSAWTCVNVRLIQKKDGTYFNIASDVPSTPLRIVALIGVFIPPLWPVLLVWYFSANRTAKPLLNEVKQFITTAPEFN